MTTKQGSTDVGIGAAFSVTDGVGPGADTCAPPLNKAVCAREVADISRGALGRSMIRISTLDALVLDL